MAQALTAQGVKQAQEVVERLTTDIGEGAKLRARADAFMWTKLDAGKYLPSSPEKQAGIGASVLVQGQPIRDGMLKTGGYVGTDLDIRDPVQLQIDGLSFFSGGQSLVQSLTQLDERKENLKQLKTQRRRLREKLLCSTNCQFERWSFLQGIHLSKQCPVDCPLRKDLQGQMIGRASTQAMDAFFSHPDIAKAPQNAQVLAETDQEIDTQEHLLLNLVKASASQTKSVPAEKDR